MDTANLKHEQSVVVPDRKESRSFTAKGEPNINAILFSCDGSSNSMKVNDKS